jgi:hypothetical protein
MLEPREAISLTPWLQPGDKAAEMILEPFQRFILIHR